ncbi:hypothetical protein D6D11_00351 [Aureobasidium pullulans]|nr:hypothetical protein D6D11_00351 [Aureobasidium pullulans]
MTLISLLQKTRPRHVHISSLAAKTPVRMHDNFDHTSHQEFSHQKARMFWGTRGGPVRAMSSCTLIGNEPISKKNFASPQLGTRPCPHGRALVHALASTNSPMRTLMLMLQSSLTILLVVTSMQQAKGPTVCGRLTRGRLAVAPCDRFPCI